MTSGADLAMFGRRSATRSIELTRKCGAALGLAVLLLSISASFAPSAFSIPKPIVTPTQSTSPERPASTEVATPNRTNGSSDRQGNDQHDGSSESSWATDAAFVVLGSILGLAASVYVLRRERKANERQEQRVLNTLLRLVRTEVTAIADTAKIRAERSLESGFIFDDPLPNEAWLNLRSSSIGWRFAENETTFPLFHRLYSLVAEANSKNVLAQSMFAFSQSSNLPEGAARSYLTRAAALVTEPYASVVSAADSALTQSTKAPVPA